MNGNPTRGGGRLAKLIARRTLRFGLLMLLAGCEQPPTESSETAEAKTSFGHSDPLQALRHIQFLGLAENNLAATWLALQEHPDDPAYQPGSTEIAGYAARIEALAKYTLEDRRMVANRTVQTRDLLAKHNHRESLATLLDGMLAVASAGVLGNYSDYCHWYVNLRQAGHGHQEALERMTKPQHSP